MNYLQKHKLIFLLFCTVKKRNDQNKQTKKKHIIIKKIVYDVKILLNTYFLLYFKYFLLLSI